MNHTPTAIVTGAARGIGLATTQLFLAKGYQVAMVDRDTEELHRAAQGLQHVLPVDCDVSDEQQVAAMVRTVLDLSGRIDALVNNAGVADFGPIEETTFARWQAVMRTNLDGVFLCSQAVIPALRQSQGSIDNIASISGLRASTLRVAYGTSKAAVIQLRKQQAVELGEHGIRVNCVAPGFIATDMTAALPEAQHQALMAQIPLGKLGLPEDIAHAVSYLAGPGAGYVTGQELHVNGGMLMS